MSRYIDAIKLKSDMMEAICQGYNEEDMLGIVNEQDTADAVEVKHGHWGKEFDGNNWTVCSNCGCRFIETIWFNPRAYDYCPNCGSRMNYKQAEIITKTVSTGTGAIMYYCGMDCRPERFFYCVYAKQDGSCTRDFCVYRATIDDMYELGFAEKMG